MTMLECVRLQELTSFFLEVHPLFIFIDTTTDGFILGVHVESALALHVQSDSSVNAHYSSDRSSNSRVTKEHTYLTMRSYRIWPSSSLASICLLQLNPYAILVECCPSMKSPSLAI